MSMRMVRVFIPETGGTKQQIVQFEMPGGDGLPLEFAEMTRQVERLRLVQRIWDAVVSEMAEAAYTGVCSEVTIGICCPSSHEAIEVSESHQGVPS